VLDRKLTHVTYVIRIESNVEKHGNSSHLYIDIRASDKTEGQNDGERRSGDWGIVAREDEK
jgi:hypothetical protein